MPNSVRPSLDAADTWGALVALADRPASSVEARAALVSALALRHTQLPHATPRADGARVLPFRGSGRARDAVRAGARKAPVVPLLGPASAAGATAPGAIGPTAGDGVTVRLVPAPGSVPGLDEGPARLTVFRSLDAGRVLGREVAAGARVVVSRREPRAGDVAVYSTRRALGLCPLAAPPSGARILGVVEAVIA